MWSRWVRSPEFKNIWALMHGTRCRSMKDTFLFLVTMEVHSWDTLRMRVNSFIR